MQKIMQKIYMIRTEGDIEGRSMQTLGYAAGNMEDIEEFYDDRKYYALQIREIYVEYITPESKIDRVKLVQRKEELEKELEIIKNKL